MTEAPIPQLVLRMAIPTIISMIITALYNMVDALFIGHLSTEATASIGIAFPYMTFIQAMGFFFGHGSGNYISRALGSRDYSHAGQMASTGFFMPMIIGALSGGLALTFLPQLTVWLGATPTIMPHACNYLRYILIASPFMMSAFTLNNQLRLQGNASIGMVGITSGAILNIALDPIFIFTLDMGVSGASMATGISQFISWCILLTGTMRPDAVHISFKAFTPTWQCCKEIAAGGLPSLFRQMFNCISAIMLNHAAVRYALPGYEEASVASFAIVTRVMMFAFSFTLGFDQGFQPVCGFNYGAKKYRRVRQSYIFALWVSTAILICFSAIGFIFAPQIIALFRSEDMAVIEIGSRVLRWQCAAFPLVGLSTATNMLFQNIRMTFRSTLLSIGRQGLFFIPAILVLPRLLGFTGVEITQAVADLCTFLLAIPFAIWISRKLLEQANDTEKAQ